MKELNYKNLDIHFQYFKKSQTYRVSKNVHVFVEVIL